MKENELKLKDVMCGDWVDVRNDASPNTPHIEKITPSHFLRDEHWYGIELTPEILEKNGFVPKFSDGCLTEYLIYKDIVDGLHEMYIRIAYFNTKEKEHKLECFYCRTGGCQIWINFIHELQHAMRLCGIEEEIVI